MDWTVIIQDIISESISGIIVALCCAFGAWFVYSTGFKGKDNNHQATERKNQLYIPLKHEIQSIRDMPENIWESIKCPNLKDVIEKSDEIVLPDEIYKKCEMFYNAICEYNSIDLDKVLGDLVFDRFVKMYSLLYGSIYYPVDRWNEKMQADIPIEEIKEKVLDFQIISHLPKNIKLIRKYEVDQDVEAYCRGMGILTPVEDHLANMFAPFLPKMEEINDKRIIEELQNKKISPATYMIKGYNFWEIFYNTTEAIQKEKLLVDIKENALDIGEDIGVLIKNVVKKYEME